MHKNLSDGAISLEPSKHLPIQSQQHITRISFEIYRGRHSGIFTVNFEHILHLFLASSIVF